MVRLPYTLDTFDEAAWKAIFGAYVKANRSHWTGAPFEIVARILREKGEYVFGFSALGTWTSKFWLGVGEEGHLEARFLRNPDLSGRMQTRLDEMERIFIAGLPAVIPGRAREES